MILERLSLENFRNFGKKKFTFSDKTTLVVGPNTSGKTSLLEGIYLLARGESFRAGRVEEMISLGRDLARVKGEVADEKPVTTDSTEGSRQRRVSLEVVLTRGWLQGKKVAKKRYFVNGVARRVTNFVGNLFGVLFRPENIEMISGSPSLRRDYLDEVLGQVDREYQRSLLSYKKGLWSRNKLLEKAKAKPQFRRALPSQLYFWDKLLIKNGQLISLKREEYLAFVNQSLLEKSGLQVEYRKNVISEKRLEEWREREILIGMTMIGPQRDDFTIVEIRNGWDLSIYGSRGEQRLAVLYLKMAQLEYIKEKTREKPVLLLDDIFAELDERFREEVMKLIDNQQTIVTGIGRENVRIKKAEVIELS